MALKWGSLLQGQFERSKARYGSSITHIESGTFDSSGHTLNMIESTWRKCDGYSSY